MTSQREKDIIIDLATMDDCFYCMYWLCGWL